MCAAGSQPKRIPNECPPALNNALETLNAAARELEVTIASNVTEILEV